ncbi:MAG TPA: ATP synthase F1 subunit delta [Chitinophagales bacterium]|nr:ATP synthase F1 subunit delta [Chitinophagales bacterium]
MSVSRIATRYAKSLLDLAMEQGLLEEVYADIHQLNIATDESREFYLMLKSPIVDTEDKHKVIEAIFKNKIHLITENWLAIMVRKKRESYLPEIIDAFIEQYNQKKQITPVTITTAKPISNALRNEIIERLKIQANLVHVELTEKVDESLIGGYILRFDNKLIDTSISRGLAILKDEFDNNDYIRKF